MDTRPFTISYGSIEHTLVIPISQFFLVSQLNDQFLKQELPNHQQPSEDFQSDEEPTSPVELLGKFIGYVTSLIDTAGSDESQQKKITSILELTFKDYESSYLNGNDIHTLAAKLLQDNDIALEEQVEAVENNTNNKQEVFPTTLPKVKELVKNYLNAKVLLHKLGVITVQNSQNKINSALFGSDITKIYAIFGGQGNTDDYFEELRDLYQTYSYLIEDILDFVSKTLNNLLKNSSQDMEKIFTQGLDVKHWLKYPNATPENDYLLSIPISCPLIGVIQLTHYALTARLLNVTPVAP